MPFFSIVIPLYNKEDHISKTLQSVLDQTFENFEVIVVDDGSTDKGLEAVKRFSDDRISIIEQSNQGVSTARNNGVKHSQSQFIALMDADDEWRSNHLAEFYRSIQKYPEAALFCNAYAIKLQEKFIQQAVYNLSSKTDIQIVADYFDASIIHPVAWTSAVAFNKKDFWDLGGFDREITSGQDIDLWIKFGMYKTIVFNPVITSCYDKTIPYSLSKKQLRKVKYDFLNTYKKEESKNKSLKKYLDLNRYAIAIQCKYHNDDEIFQLLKKDIDERSLTWKQRFLLYCPSFFVSWLKRIHSCLIKRNIYLTAFR